MKPETREETIKSLTQPKGAGRGSSVPGSPRPGVLASGGHDFQAGMPSSALRTKLSPRSRSPARDSYPMNSTYTPDRAPQLPSHPNFPGDGSPLPRRRRDNGMSDNVQGSPVLSSSFLPEDSNSFVTPAPLRVHPRLAPPSTAQRPSQHMPTSSPAPFWKYADFGSTPARTWDVSPIKGLGPAPNLMPQSSSPPGPATSGLDTGDSPSRGAGPVIKIERENVIPALGDLDEEEAAPSFDLTRYVSRWEGMLHTALLTRSIGASKASDHIMPSRHRPVPSASTSLDAHEFRW